MFIPHLEHIIIISNKEFFSLSLASCEDGSVRLSIDNRSPESYELIDDELARGRVEVCSGGNYETVCGDVWSFESASVICSQLGFSPYGKLDLLGSMT